ncbi:HNH endonuclease [Chrysiogenes arsenatis]|uniref:HNH endonuclease n=1 Tax=Chrysiogenes arsenatis TaxID=309797 RepID=UPI0003F77CD5|nr:HNH endonuclease signature motif containing protein [Chrysiogenes arsenatis]
MASLIKVSDISWRQPFVDRRREFHLWGVQPDVKKHCRFEDGTKRLLRIAFDSNLGLDIDVLDYFQITSRRKVSFPKALQEVVKLVVIDNPDSYFTVTVMDAQAIPKEAASPSTEGVASIKTRVGQQQFRKSLLNYWGGCALSGLDFPDILRASHIKPWCLSDDRERIDFFNGLLLSPTFDALFDKGFISFDNEGDILIGDSVRGMAGELGLSDGMRLRKIEEAHRKYLREHRNIFGFSSQEVACGESNG